MRCNDIIKRLEALSDPTAIEGMARFGITPEQTFGVTMPILRNLAKELGTSHELAQQLWASNIRETRILASLVEDPKLVTEAQMESWVKQFDTWEICDQCISNLFKKTGFAYQKVFEWSARDEEFVKRAGFALIAYLANSDKKASDEKFEKFFPIIKRESTDERNFVKKSVNWALRQIGKRNPELNKLAINLAEEIKTLDSKAAKWIAADALRELTSEAVHKRLVKKWGKY